MTTVYLQHTVSNVYVSQTDHHHGRSPADDKSKPLAIDCDACGPFLVKEGGVYRPELVPLTDDQVADKERIEREGNLAVKQAAVALAESAAALVSGEGSRRGRARKRIAAD